MTSIDSFEIRPFSRKRRHRTEHGYTAKCPECGKRKYLHKGIRIEKKDPRGFVTTWSLPWHVPTGTPKCLGRRFTQAEITEVT